LQEKAIISSLLFRIVENFSLTVIWCTKLVTALYS